MKNIIKKKSFTFAVDIVNTCRAIQTEQKEFIITKQIVRSGPAIGALVREAEHAESKKDFIHKFSIAQKEANETLYWLELMEATQYLSNSLFKELHYKGTELIKLITSILKTSKTNLNN